MAKRKILLSGLIFLTVFLSLGYAKEIGSNRITPIQLNSISVDTTKEKTRISLTVEIKEPSNTLPATEVKKAIQKFLEYFFLGLVLPDDKFWVNLNPNEPSRIIDSILADTDLGRIMLYADLKLKKETSGLFNPQVSEMGREFWNRLYKKASDLTIDKIPVINRVWIVPDEVVVYETANQLSIIKSKLKVCLEEENTAQNTGLKDKREKELQDYASRLIEELILPSLTKCVNESNSYADLREIYQALILARWFKKNFGPSQNTLLQNLSYEVIKDTEIGFLYRPEQIYREYTNSFKKGRYSLTHGDGFYSVTTIIQYFIGGVTFQKIDTQKGFSQIKSDDRLIYIATFVIPDDSIEKPLTLVKNTMELNLGKPQEQEIAVAFGDVKNLPPVCPIVEFVEQEIIGHGIRKEEVFI